MTVYTGATVKTYFALTDHLGSVHALADQSGNIVESYRYDAWGRVLGVYDGNNNPLTQSAIGNHYLWQGREYSWNAALYFFRTRWYDPVAGRWLSNDPIGINGGLNQYLFCGDSPINFVDPFGLLFGEGDILGVGGPVDRFVSGLLGVNHVTYGIQRMAITSQTGVDPGPMPPVREIDFYGHADIRVPLYTDDNCSHKSKPTGQYAQLHFWPMQSYFGQSPSDYTVEEDTGPMGFIFYDYWATPAEDRSLLQDWQRRSQSPPGGGTSYWDYWSPLNNCLFRAIIESVRH